MPGLMHTDTKWWSSDLGLLLPVPTLTFSAMKKNVFMSYVRTYTIFLKLISVKRSQTSCTSTIFAFLWFCTWNSIYLGALIIFSKFFLNIELKSWLNHNFKNSIFFLKSSLILWRVQPSTNPKICVFTLHWTVSIIYRWLFPLPHSALFPFKISSEQKSKKYKRQSGFSSSVPL